MSTAADRLSVETYLRTLEKLLRDAPEDLKAELLEDVAQHIEDGRALGRNDQQILAALGNPEAVVAPLAPELTVPGIQARLGRNRMALGIAALILGVVVAVIDRGLTDALSGLLFGEAVPDSEGFSQGAIYELGAIQLLIFAIFGPGIAVSVVMRGNAARIYSIAAAVCMTGLLAAFITGGGIFYIPSMVTAWMLAGANRRGARSMMRVRRLKLIRIVGGICLLLPVAFLVSGLFTGMGQGVGTYLYIALGLVCGIGFLMNFRSALWTTCISGAALLAASVVDQGLLQAAFWLCGAGYFCFGLYGLMWFQPRGTNRG